MPRANLGQLLGNVDASTTPTVAEERAQPVEVLAAEASVAKVERPSSAALAGEEVAAGAAYLRFVRKDTRLREDQLEALTAHARRLNRKRRTAGPRVTENTLIRVAVDLLMERIEAAAGDSEAALLESVRR